MSDRERLVRSRALSPGQRALLQQLLQMRQYELDRRVALRQGGGDDGPQPQPDPGSGREPGLARTDADIVELGAVSDALARVHDSSFGQCAECGEAIAFERLKLRPWALHCEACAAKCGCGCGDSALPFTPAVTPPAKL